MLNPGDLMRMKREWNHMSSYFPRSCVLLEWVSSEYMWRVLCTETLSFKRIVPDLLSERYEILESSPNSSEVIP